MSPPAPHQDLPGLQEQIAALLGELGAPGS